MGLHTLPVELACVIFQQLNMRDQIALVSCCKATLTAVRGMRWLGTVLELALKEHQLPSFIQWLHSQRCGFDSLRLTAGSSSPQLSEQLLQALAGRRLTSAAIRWEGPFVLCGPGEAQLPPQLQELSIVAHSFDVRASLSQLTTLTALTLEHPWAKSAALTLCPGWLPASLAGLVLEGLCCNPFQQGGQFPPCLQDLRLDFTCITKAAGAEVLADAEATTATAREALSWLPKLPGLTSFELNGAGLDQAPQELTALTGLKRLSLCAAARLGDGAPIQPLLGMLQLTHLDLGDTWLKEVPVALLRLPQLQSLRLDTMPQLQLVRFSQSTAPLAHLALDQLAALASCEEFAWLGSLQRLEVYQDSDLWDDWQEEEEEEECLLQLAPDCRERLFEVVSRLPSLREVFFADVLEQGEGAARAFQALKLARPDVKVHSTKV